MATLLPFLGCRARNACVAVTPEGGTTAVRQGAGDVPRDPGNWDRFRVELIDILPQRRLVASIAPALAPASAGAPAAIAVPYLHQEPNSCTATALAMLLAWKGRGTDLSHAVVLDAWKRGGGSTTILAAGDPEFIWKFCREHNVSHTAEQGSMAMLKDFVRTGRAFYALTKAWTDQPLGHARVVVGFDAAKDEVIVHDPASGPYGRISATIFDQLWDNRWYGPQTRLVFRLT